MKQTEKLTHVKESARLRKLYHRTKQIRKAMRPYWVDQSMQEGLIDALTDLMHWANYFEVNGVDFDAALSQATDHYSFEKG